MSAETQAQLPDVAGAVERGLAFLAESQLPSGQFSTYVGTDLRSNGTFESSPFTTALVVHSISGSSAPGTRQMIDRALDYLSAEMEPGGAWRYWASDHGGHEVIPADLDDIACASQVLRRYGRSIPANRRLVLANRDRRGRFYTWIAPRYAPPPLSPAFWRVARRQTGARDFFKDNEISGRDVSCVVNANVLFYLGDGRAARPVVKYLIEVMRRRAERSSDSWYESAFPFYYSVARCIAAGITGLAGLSGEITERIGVAQREQGCLGEGSLETALAAGALHYLGQCSPTLIRACDFLLGAQAEDGSWPAEPLYHGGPPRELRWGSAELTTGFCVEALLPLVDEQRVA
ncbi:MAG: hypothetical protein QOI64_393 [Solirubrobacteraceae bacterium]|jgi:hypothetical protein|nr:hypothetical protein [Solirubrobacteraceae bacterium]